MLLPRQHAVRFHRLAVAPAIWRGPRASSDLGQRDDEWCSCHQTSRSASKGGNLGRRAWPTVRLCTPAGRRPIGWAPSSFAWSADATSQWFYPRYLAGLQPSRRWTVTGWVTAGTRAAARTWTSVRRARTCGWLGHFSTAACRAISDPRPSFLQLAESERAPVDYLAQEDLEAAPSAEALARAYKLLIFPGHHEYVTDREYDLVEGYRDVGGNLMFLSANNFFMRVVRNVVRDPQRQGVARPRAAGGGLIGVQYFSTTTARNGSLVLHRRLNNGSFPHPTRPD